ncbi:hypothetical protein pipiens_020335, partial [Culex pipiens pipiens]
ENTFFVFLTFWATAIADNFWRTESWTEFVTSGRLLDTQCSYLDFWSIGSDVTPGDIKSGEPVQHRKLSSNRKNRRGTSWSAQLDHLGCGVVVVGSGISASEGQLNNSGQHSPEQRPVIAWTENQNHIEKLRNHFNKWITKTKPYNPLDTSFLIAWTTWEVTERQPDAELSATRKKNKTKFGS